MAFVAIEPRYRAELQKLGLETAHDFLELPGTILAGHPDRHVRQVHLGSGAAALSAFLKREHCVRWRERLGSAWRGMGFVSQSCREARLLQQLRQAGINCPEPLAAGEDDQGRAFLLLRALTGMRELRAVLTENRTDRRKLCRDLGRALARVHEAGFTHPDLCSKHVLIDDAGEVFLLDWQRSRRWRWVSWRQRARDLALLHATVADDLASPRERLVCLAAYLRACGASISKARSRSLAVAIQQQAERLRRRAKIRAMLQPPLPAGAQELVWLDGEALCVTRTFLEEVGGQLPSWLPSTPSQTSGPQTRFSRHRLGSKPVDLVRRWASRPWAWLWCCLRRWRLSTPEVKQAGTVFLLQRYGIVTPRLLAVGQRFPRPWQTESFLLTESLAGSTNLMHWLTLRPNRNAHARRPVIEQAGWLLRHLHEAAFYLRGAVRAGEACPLVVVEHQGQPTTVAVNDLAGVQRIRRGGRRRAGADVVYLARLLKAAGCSRADCLRLVRAYQGKERTVDLRRVCRPLLAR